MALNLRVLGLLVCVVTAGSVSLAAQGRGRYKATPDRALIVTREVLTRQGFVVVRVERAGNDQVVWYRRGNMGKGRGQGPPVKMIIRREADRVIFVDTPRGILVDIDLRLRL